jgi:hypothetical protein
MGEFEQVEHKSFGGGFLFSERQIDAGTVLDAWFISDEKVRTVLAKAQYWTKPQTDPLKFSKQKRKSAFSQWKKLHARPKLEDSSLPRKVHTLRESELEDEAV